MRRGSFLVADDGSTPGRPLVACFYCRARVGQEHGAGCVMRRRTVVLRATVEFVARAPEDWDAEMVRFYYQDGTWCASNLPSMIEEHLGPDEDHRCICASTTVEFVREATEEDEAESAVRVAELVD